MTENEAIKELKAQIETAESMISYNMDFEPKHDNSVLENKIKTAKMAISAIEEIQQYRAIGTVERFQQLAEQFKPHVADKTSCPERHCNKCDKYRKENEKYHAIGTVEECREARERQRAKKPIEYDKHYYKCVCGSELSVTDDDLYVYGCEPPKYCEKCGQSLSWESDAD